MTKNTNLKIGIALGSGSSRGWAHIGILHALREIGIEPDIVCGSSIGSLIGAAYVSDKLENLESWVCSLTKLETVKFFELDSSFTGIVNTERFHDFLNEFVCSDNTTIETLSKLYASVSTDLETGREIWLSKGPLIQAVWASISLPGLFPAIRNDDRWLVDGGLVNPVPVSVCRALGADIVIAVNLNGDIVGKHFKKVKSEIRNGNHFVNKITDLVKEYTDSVFPTTKDDEQPPSIFEAIAGSFNITQDRITRSRMAGDPPDILLTPQLSQIGLLEFYRAAEAIEEGKACVERMRLQIEHIFQKS